MTTPTPPIPTFTDGNLGHATQLNALGSNITNLYNYALGGFKTAPPFCIANQTTAQNIPQATYTAIQFQSTIVNVDNMWVASQASQLTVHTAGTYLLWAQAAWSGDTTGYRGQLIGVNGVGPANQVAGVNMPNNPGGYVTSSCFAMYNLSVGSIIYNSVWQNATDRSGATPSGSLPTIVGSLINSSLAALWVSQ